MEKKTHGFTMPNGDTHVFIPPAPTETERGGIIAKEKTTESVEAAVGKDGKLYVPAADETLTKEDAAVDRVLKILAVNDDGTFKVGWADEAGGDVTDVKIDGKSIVENGIVEIPIGSDTTPGIFKVPGETYGLFKDNENYIRLVSLNNSEIDKRFPAKPLLGNYIDYAVKAAMTDGKGAPWTADEQAAARERMGISTNTIADMFCPEFEESGNPVTCYPVEHYPLDIVASWKPIQEGSGNPYPAGCGPNLLDISQMKTVTNNGITYELKNGGIWVHGTATARSDSPVFDISFLEEGSYAGIKIEGISQQIVVRKNGESTNEYYVFNQTPVVIEEGDQPQYIYFVVENGTTIDKTVYPMICKSTEWQTVYYPYENIRPIHGRDNVTIERCGKNISPPYTKNGTVKLNTPIMRETKATLSFNGTATKENLQFNIYVHYYDDRFAYCKFSGKTVAGTTRYILTANLPAGTQILRLYVSDSPFEKINDWQLTLDFGSPETYEQYNAQVDAVQLPQEGIYGGTLDVISGIGTADWTVRTFDGTENWYTWGVDDITEGITGFHSFDVDDYDYAYTSNAFSSHIISNPSSWGGGSIGFGFANENSARYFFVSVYNELLDNTESNEKAVESWKAYLAEQYTAGTPVQIAYKLAEPIPFQVEGEQILALKGINNILTDADTVTVTGREDPVHYVDKKFAELSAAIVASASEAE